MKNDKSTVQCIYSGLSSLDFSLPATIDPLELFMSHLGFFMSFHKISGIADYPPKADKSAVPAINRGLRVVAPIDDTLDISLTFIKTHV
jgi:hypothetical protein